MTPVAAAPILFGNSVTGRVRLATDSASTNYFSPSTAVVGFSTGSRHPSWSEACSLMSAPICSQSSNLESRLSWDCTSSPTHSRPTSSSLSPTSPSRRRQSSRASPTNQARPLGSGPRRRCFRPLRYSWRPIRAFCRTAEPCRGASRLSHRKRRNPRRADSFFSPARQSYAARFSDAGRLSIGLATE